MIVHTSSGQQVWLNPYHVVQLRELSNERTEITTTNSAFTMAEEFKLVVRRVTRGLE